MDCVAIFGYTSRKQAKNLVHDIGAVCFKLRV